MPGSPFSARMLPHSRLWRLIQAALLLSLATAVAWAGFNRPHHAPAVSLPFHGAAYQPYRQDQSPGQHEPSVAEIDADLAVLAQQVRALRTYSSRGSLRALPRLADYHGLDVLQGVWVDGDAVRSREEIEAAVQSAPGKNVTGLLVGNEALLRGDLKVEVLVAYIDEVRRRTGKKVSTAETWATWLQHPELVAKVDFIALHVLPYWEETTTQGAVAYTLARIREVQAAYPHKRVIVAEVGWPSAGRSRWDLHPGLATQAQFLRSVLAETERAGVEAFVMEAVDGPWKYTIEGSVGPYWGFLNAAREPKFPWRGPIYERPHWQMLAGFSISGGLLIFAWLARRSPNYRHGLMLQGAGGFAAVSFVAWLLDHAMARYFTMAEASVWVGLGGLLVLLLLVLSADLTEAAASIGRRGRGEASRGDSLTGPVPVSIHMPIHRETPDVVIPSLRSLARLDWPDFEVIVVDNNTPEATLWRPVEAECERLNAALGRPVFRFIHVEGLAGFKAGALNLALQHTRADAGIIGVIDADYIVDPSWLRRAVPYFADPAIGFVQAPQDHRGVVDSVERAMGWEYAGFFNIGMVNRDHDNAIIQHGTMVLIRRAALAGCGGWAEWCITEDAELGLRLHAAGWGSAYLRDTLGRGLLPDDWSGYARQRHRWAYGGMRILRRHWRLFLPASPLTLRQRLRYVSGWLPWIGDGIGLAFAALSVVWTGLSLVFPNHVEIPDPVLFGPPLLAFATRSAIAFAVHRVRVPCGPGDSLRATLAGIALAPTIGRAVIHAALMPGAPFRRTPKGTRVAGLGRALSGVAFELGLAAALLAAAILSLVYYPSAPASALWGGALLVQAVPPLLAVALAVAASRRGPVSPSLEALKEPRPA
jgi:exo-beta-1,3-glucanase (GH17 family)